MQTAPEDAEAPALASSTPEGKARLLAYYAALGRFVDMFAKAEMAVHIVLRTYAKLNTDAGRALLSGVRVDETKRQLGRLRDVGLISEADWADMEPSFQQLGIINGARNDILHHGAISVAEGNGLVTNAAMALTRERVTGFPISPEILGDMTADLWKIIVHLHVRHMGRPSETDPPEVNAVLRAAWRYKPQTKHLAKSQPRARAGHTNKPARKGRLPPSEG